MKQKKYIGVKEILAKPMTREDYNDYRGWKLPADENGKDTGYLVEYLNGSASNHPDHKGYISWSPTEAFDESYRETEAMTFGIAIEALKLGKLIARTGWNGKELFVFKQVPALIDHPIVPKMTSTPQDFKDRMMARSQKLNYRNQMCIVDAVGNIDSWVPSSSDIFSEDWRIVEPNEQLQE